MGKRGKILIALFVVLVVFVGLGLGLAIAFAKLDMPKDIIFNNGYLSWTEVRGASSYLVQEGDDTPEKVGGASFGVSKQGTFTVKITAVGKGILRDSEPAILEITNDLTALKKGFAPTYSAGVAGNGVISASGINHYDILRFYWKINSFSSFSKTLPIEANILRVEAEGLSDADYTANGRNLTINRAYLGQFSKGAVIPIEVFLDNSDSYVFALCFSDKTVPETTLTDYKFSVDLDKLTYTGETKTGASVKFDATLGSSTIIKLSVNGIEVKSMAEKDGQRIYYWYVGGTGGKSEIFFTQHFFEALGVGNGIFTVHTAVGDVYFYCETSASANRVYNFKNNFDHANLDQILEWNYYAGNDAVFEIKINDTIYKSDGNGKERFSGNSFNLNGLSISSGSKIILTAFLDGQPSPVQTVNYFPPTERQKIYLQKTFEYLGETHNYYIDSYDEWEALVHFVIQSTQKAEQIAYTSASQGGFFKGQTYPGFVAYIDPSLLGSMSTQASLGKVSSISEEYTQSYREASKIALLISTNTGFGNEFTALFSIKSTSVAQGKTPGAEQGAYTQYQAMSPYQSVTPRASDFSEFAIDKYTRTAVVETSDELYFAVEAGLRPLPKAGSVAETIYNIARDIMRNIADDSMSDTEKVIAIYDWICYNVSYDNAVISEMAAQGDNPSSDTYNKFYGRNCFYMEGVFLDGIAVCNGLSKAVALMCGIEGIPCVKVNGLVTEGAHAWNKVFILGSWYMIDTTWGNAKKLIGSVTQEYLEHKYLMFKNAESRGGETNPAFNNKREEYDEFPKKFVANDIFFDTNANKIFVKDGKVFDHIINNTADATALGEYYAQASISQQKNVGFYAYLNPITTTSLSTDISNAVSAKSEGSVTLQTSVSNVINEMGERFFQIKYTSSLASASLSQNGDKIEWGEVAGVSEYYISEAGNPRRKVTGTQADLSLYGSYPVTVYAVGGSSETSSVINVVREFEYNGKQRVYYNLGGGLPFFINLVKRSDESFVRAEAIGLKSSHYYVDGNVLNIDTSFASMFNAGAIIDLKVVLSSPRGERILEYAVQFVSGIDGGVLGSNVFGIDVENYGADIFQVPLMRAESDSVSLSCDGTMLTIANWGMNAPRNTIQIKTDFLRTLSEGNYTFVLHTASADIYFYIYINNNPIQIPKGEVSAEILPYTQKKFSYLGQEYDHYIENYEELEIITHYLIMSTGRVDKFPYAENTTTYFTKNQSYPGFEVYIEPSVLSDAVGVNNAKKVASIVSSKAINSYREAVKAVSSVTDYLGNKYKVIFSIYSANVPSEAYRTGQTTSQNYNQFSAYKPYKTLTPRAVDYNDFAINKYAKTQTVATSDELAFAVEAGCKPILEVGSSAEIIYNLALGVLRQIIDDSMTDYQKARAIYEWLCYEVAYDHNALADMKVQGDDPNKDTYNEFYARRCFFLEGVFVDKIAVCNGLAKAFTLMCGIEGIRSVKVTGTVPSGAHAWNKVYLDGSWYMVDTTWGNANVDDGVSVEEYIIDEYFLFKGETSHGRVEDKTFTYYFRSNDTYFNRYANELFVYNGIVYDYIIESDIEARLFAEYHKSVLDTFSVSVQTEDSSYLQTLLSELNKDGQNYGSVSLGNNSFTQYMIYKI